MRTITINNEEIKLHCMGDERIKQISNLVNIYHPNWKTDSYAGIRFNQCAKLLREMEWNSKYDQTEQETNR